MQNMKSIGLKTKELQSNKVEASDFAISQIRTSLPVATLLIVIRPGHQICLVHPL